MPYNVIVVLLICTNVLPPLVYYYQYIYLEAEVWNIEM